MCCIRNIYIVLKDAKGGGYCCYANSKECMQRASPLL